MERYDSLNGLRAWSTIGIISAHVLFNLPSSLESNLLTNNFIPYCANLVFLFMIVSAFSMCCGYYQKFKEKKIDLNVFYTRRYSRIWPFFALLVLIDVILKPSMSEVYEAFADLTLCFGFIPNADIQVIGVGWFLGLIFAFYIAFPFFIFLIDNKARAWFVLLISIAMNIIVSSYFSRPELLPRMVDKWNIVYSFPTFVAGGIIYLYVDKFKKLVKAKYFLLVLLIALSAALIVCNQIRFYPKLALFVLWTIYAIVDSISSKRSFFKNQVVDYISGISMELYLCHMVIFRFYERFHLIPNTGIPAADYTITLISTLIGSVIFAHVVKYIVFPKVGFVIGNLKNKKS